MKAGIIALLVLLASFGSIWAQTNDKNILDEEKLKEEERQRGESIYKTIKELVPVFSEIEYYGGEIVDVHIGKTNGLGESILIHVEKGVTYGIISFIDNERVFDLNSYAFYLNEEKEVIIQSKDSTLEKYSRLMLYPAESETYSIYIKPILFYSGYSEAYYCTVVFRKKE